MADWFGDRHDEVQRTREDAAIDQAIGTLEKPQAELRVDAPKQEGETLTDLKLSKPPTAGTPAERVQGEAIVPAQGEAQAKPFEPGVMHDKKRKEFTVEPPEVQAVRQQYKDELAKIMSGETVVEEVGKAGRRLAEALHPGIRTAAIALGLDETGADALATGFVEFAAGLPGTDESELAAGVETALAVLPMVGATIKGGKMVGKVADEIGKAVDLLKSERGSISFGKGKQEVAAPQKAIPTWEQAINLDEADRSFQTLLKDHKDRLSKQRRGVREDVVVGAEADELQQSKMAWEHVLEIPPGTILPDSEVKALAKTFEAHTQPTIDLAKYIQANPQDMDAKIALIQQLGDVERGLNAVAGVYAETGRAERQLNRRLPIPREVDPKTAEQIRIADPYIQQWLEFFDKQKALADIGLPSKSIDDLATIVSSLKTPREVAKLIKDMRDGRLSVGDWWSAWVYFSALSNPATHMANLSGLPLMATTTVVERALAKKIGPEAARSVIEDDRLGLGVVSGEAHQMMLGAVNGIHNAIATSAAIAEQGAAFATGKSAAQRTAAEKVQGGLGGFAALLNAIESGEAGKLTEAGVSKPIRQITAARSGYDGMLGDIVDTIGMTIEAPKMALAAEDAFMKTVFRDMQRGALAHRLATFRAGESVGPVYEREFSNLMEHPTIGMLKEMDEFAERNTFSKSLEGRMASFEHAFGSPAMKPFVMFIKTTARIAEEGAQRTPLVGFLTQQLRDDLMAGGSRAALARAKIHYGIGVALVATSLALEGRISGNGPANPAMKAVWDSEYLPLSFRAGGYDYQFGRTDPLALWLGDVADFVTMMRDLPDAVAQEMAVGYTMAFVNNMASKTFAQSTSEFFGLFKRRSNETSQEQAVRVRHYLEGQAARVAVPGLLYAVDRAYFDNVMRETRSLGEKVAGRTPGESASLFPKLDYWGNVEIYETFGPEILSHIRIRKALNDPVNLEVLKQKAELPNIPKIVDGQEVTAQEAYELRLLFAKGITTSMYGSGPVNLHEALHLTMQQPWYKDAPGPAENNLFRATALRSVATDYLSAAMQEMAKKYPKFLRLSKELELHQQMTGIPKEDTLQHIQEQLTR